MWRHRHRTAGDTLSGIAERCDVPERRLMRLNPQVEGSRDLRVGMELRCGQTPSEWRANRSRAR
uniref:LysM peptidoglycan-binding domain-containing protein n=1 Tax=Microvirga soli TaxID=1854496 RepID=UPI0035E3F4CD